MHDEIKKIGAHAFSNLKNTEIEFNFKEKDIFVDDHAFTNFKFKYIYLSKDGSKLTLSLNVLPELEDSCIREELPELEAGNGVFEPILQLKNKWFNNNFRKNYVQLKVWKENKKIKFIPPEFTIEIFQANQMEKYFVNNNNQRWAKLVKALEFDTLKEPEKQNSLADLMKIYYAIGGFSENQGESERAFDYIIKYVAKIDRHNFTPSMIGEEIHSRFSRIVLKGEYNKMFAQFFMKYYKDNPEFMSFELRDQYGKKMERQDYLCFAHNSFDSILKNYPNRVVNGNEERALLSPKFVAEHSYFINYQDIEDGNERLADIIGKYGYSQKQFEHIQEIYDTAKKLKESYIIRADKSKEDDLIQFRILEKDDPLGFVLGDITNCCQVLGGAGESCVDDGYTNPNAGFLVFEENILDEDGVPAGDTRILGQAYIWYDPKTKTVCYDNIEIPTKVLHELRSGDKTDGKISSKALIDAVERSAESIMREMNKDGVKVERVTTGEGYNDLKRELSQKFVKENNPIAEHRKYIGYSDARKAQYIIKTYDELTKEYGDIIKKSVTEAKKDIQEVREMNSLNEHSL